MCIPAFFMPYRQRYPYFFFSFLLADTLIRPYGKKSARRIVGADRRIRPHERVFFIMWLEIVFHPTPAPPLRREGNT